MKSSEITISGQGTVTVHRPCAAEVLCRRPHSHEKMLETIGKHISFSKRSCHIKAQFSSAETDIEIYLKNLWENLQTKN